MPLAMNVMLMCNNIFKNQHKGLVKKAERCIYSERILIVLGTPKLLREQAFGTATLYLARLRTAISFSFDLRTKQLSTFAFLGWQFTT